MTPAVGAGHSPIRVLLVEDDEDDYVLTRDILRAIGPARMELQWVETPDAALAALETGAHDVCLLDYRLGASTGLELLALIRERGWHGPAILLTGQEDAEIDHRAMEAGATDFLEKSQLTPTLLDRSIRYALQHARTLEALRRSQTGFRELIERLPDGIGVMRGERLVYATPRLVSMLGCASAEELEGLTEADLAERFTRVEDRGVELARLREALLTGGAVAPTEIRLQRKGGAPLLAEMAQVPAVFDGQTCRVLIVRDLTERKQLQARLQLADRMASLGTLAAGIAHEINNPLTFTLANLENLETGLPLLELPVTEGTEVRRMLSDARMGARRVRDIVRQLKMFSRLEEDARPEPVDVKRVFETSISMAWNEIRHRARLVRVYGEPLLVEVNEGRLGQVLLNLLVNAAQAIPEGNVEGHEIRVVTRAHEAGVALEVRDTGVGMSPEQLERVFEPFFTSKPVGMGTGLGLSICQGIVTGYGGRIEVESVPGRGSTFRIILPAAPARQAAPAAPTAPLPAGAPRQGRILVVDDEVQVGTAIRRTLQREHQVVVLTSSLEAQARLLGGERFDVILCDLMMPELSGMELYLSIVSGAPEVAGKMVFLTGGAFTPQTREFLDVVENLRVDKPFSPTELRALVQSLVK
jgi:PAS domain S-box-containing protein